MPADAMVARLDWPPSRTISHFGRAKRPMLSAGCVPMRSRHDRETSIARSKRQGPELHVREARDSRCCYSFAGVAQIRDCLFAVADDNEFEHALRLCLAGGAGGDRPAEDAARGAGAQRLLRFILQLDAEVIGDARGNADSLP